MNPTILLIPLCGVTILGAAMLAGRFGDETAPKAIGAALFLLGAASIGTILFARRMKAWVDRLAEDQRRAERDEDL